MLNYKITHTIYDSLNSVIYRALRQTDGQPVVLKFLREAYPSPEKIAQFQREYELTHRLQHPGIIDAYNIESHDNRWFIALEDFGAQSLHQLNLAGQLSLNDFLTLAIEIVETLLYLHQNYIIHKDINPSNILLNPTIQQIKIIDFGISTVLSRETSTFRNPNLIEGTLAYISPEQTGRMNRSIDYRTDFYSLGATFYELLTGSLPFPTTDALELVHSHLAKPPIPPHKLNPDISEALSQILLKLMAKNAEDRYQSASGLKADLEECRNRLQTSGQIAPFPLATQDISDQLQIPQKLYGREREVETLLSAFESVTASSDKQNSLGQLMLVSGYSGIGKTTLVQEIYKPITRSRGYFIAGKFDQLQRNIPYASLIQAFRSLIKQLLAETEIKIAQWREKLRAALGSNGQIIIEVIPELETIIGSQPAVPELPPAEAKNRFNLVFQNFIKVFTQPEHPLAIFLDDLQWADSASLQLIQLFMTAPESQYLFLIGAYRDNEVSAAHPLMLTVEEIKKAQTNLSEISLKPLASPSVTQLIADTLHQTPQQVQPLAELVQTKTGGNPFFLTEFLKTLWGEGLLKFDYNSGGWQWDIQQIEAQPITDNVVDLMAAKLHQLPPEIETALQFAACIGNAFDLATLARVAATSSRATALALKSAMNQGFIMALSNDYPLMEQEVEGLLERLTVEYKFAHDRIQQAAYSLIPDADKPGLHLRIGRLLLQQTPTKEREQKLFAIVNQLNLGQNLLESTTEREELAQLNLEAGKKAKASAAYKSAFSYLQVGLQLLEQEPWQQQYDLALALYEQSAEAAYLSGNFDRMEQLCEVVLQSATTVLDKMQVYTVKIQARMAKSLVREAVETGLQALKLLGITFPDRPTQEDVINGLQDTKVALAGREIEELIDLPEMTNPAKLAAIQIMLAVSAPCYIARQDLLPLMIFKWVFLSVKYGHAAESIPGYSWYGLLLCAFFEDIDTGYRFGKLALDLIDKLNEKKYEATSYLLFGHFVNHWKKHISDTLRLLLKGYQSGAQMGDLEFASLNATTFCIDASLIGKNLLKVDTDMEVYDKVVLSFKQSTHHQWHKMFWQFLRQLKHQSNDPHKLEGTIFKKSEFLHEGQEDDSGKFNVYLIELILSYLFNELEGAIENAAQAQKYISNAVGAVFFPFYIFYASLTHLAIYPDSSEPEQQRILETVTANQEKMHHWAQHAPMNYLHKYYLVEAELTRVLNNDLQARDYYDRAIALAQENQYLNEEALAYELAARFYLSRQIAHLARFYLQEAHYAYQRWGATAKVKHLETHYPQLLNRQTTNKGTLTTSISGSSSGETLDLATVLKASQAISSEIKLDKLLAQLLNLAIENAGAQKGILILSDNNQLKIEAAKLPDAQVEILNAVPLQSTNLLPPAIIHYVARTQENVVLSDATHEGIFTREPYILQQHPKSILSAPIINQGKLRGIIYLENNLATAAFTQERIELLQVISAQAAISLENALLYRTLEDKVIERTAQLAEANEEITRLNECLKAENLRMAAELQVTQQLQEKMLPREAEIQEISQLDIAGFMQPADEVGGDYYDVLKYGDRITIAIGDVTGHGLESGMLMVMVQTAVRTLLVNGETDPVKFLTTINQTIYDNVGRMRSEKNLTLALLDYAENTLKISGQHEEVILVRADGTLERIDTIDLGFPIGLDTEIADFISQTEVQLNAGDIVALYTDGITEAENLEGEQYGIERLCDVLAHNCQHSAEEIRQLAIENLRQFIGTQKVFDDITLVVVKQK